MQTDSLSSDPAERKYRGMRDAFRKLWAEGGVGRFSRGFVPCVLRAVPGSAALLTTAIRVKEVGEVWLAAHEERQRESLAPLLRRPPLA